MAFGDVIQEFGEADQNSVTLTWGTDGSTPTAGNLLILIYGDRNNGTTTPSGWTELYSVDPWSGSGSTRTVVAAKIAASSESNITWNISGGRPAYWCIEVEGPFESLSGLAILEHSGHAENTVNKSTGLQPGTSGTLSQASNLVVVASTYRGVDNNNAPTGSSVDQGFTTGTVQGYAGSFTYGIVPAYKVTTTTTSLNPTITWTTLLESNFLTVSVMVVLKKQAAGGTNFDASASDGLNMTDTPAPVAGLFAAPSDGLDAGDTAGALADFFAGVADGLDLSESPGATKQMTVTVTDGLDVGSTPTPSAGYPVNAGDGVTLSDTPTVTAQLAGSALDALTLSEALAVTAALLGTAADGVSLTDVGAYEGLAAIIASAADGLLLSDTPVGAAQLRAALADGVTLAEVLAGAAGRLATAADGLIVSEALLINLGLALADGVTVADTGAVSAQFNVTATDGLTLAESLAVIAALLAAASDGVTLTDVAVDVSQLPSGLVSITFTGRRGSVTFTVKAPGITFS